MKKKMLVTGGAGFIGANVADYYLSKGHHVTIIDNLCRKGAVLNLQWLCKRHKKLDFVKANVVRDQKKLDKTVRGKSVVFHFAGQVAVTTSVVRPREDFLTNALGTFNVLEAVRCNAPEARMLFSSTNKVYGGMEDIRILRKLNRYAYAAFPDGIPESRL
jgi:CDP-paratose 2-epimerase